MVGAPNYAPSLCSVAGLLLALALESAYEDTLPLLHGFLNCTRFPFPRRIRLTRRVLCSIQSMYRAASVLLWHHTRQLAHTRCCGAQAGTITQCFGDVRGPGVGRLL